jgi:hypothetical protein
MALEFQTSVRVDVETGEPVRVPDITDNVVAWGEALNALAGATVFSDLTLQYTKSQILSAHQNFRVARDNSVSPSVDYSNNQCVMLRSVSYRVYPGTFQIQLTTTKLGLATSVTTATARVFFDITSSQTSGSTEIINPNNANGWPLVYGVGGLRSWTITIPSDVVLATIGESINNSLQIGIVEKNGNLQSTQYRVGAATATAYNALINGSNVLISTLTP